MTPQEKKELVLKKMNEGDKRSYNELMADLELSIWTEKYKQRGHIERFLKTIRK